jgi:exosortase/archaeosortase family protein
MVKLLARLRQDVPERFLIALTVCLAFLVFITADQIHWWRLKPDYAFGWLVPLFVVYVVADRWPRLREIFRAAGPSPLAAPLRGVLSAAAGLSMGVGMLVFLFGAFYRAGFGATQPGSLALALGLPGVLLGMLYFNVPDGRLGAEPPSSVWGGLRADARLRAVGLFLFPAAIWILSAPLVTAVENAVSLFLLRKVVTVVFAVFNFLGYPMIQEGNVLVLPQGRVGVVDACSGIRSLTGCLFAGAFLAAVYFKDFWKKIALIAAAMGFAIGANLMRSLFLTAWAYAFGPNAIEGSLHDITGLAVLGITVGGLFGLLPFFSGSNWRRWTKSSSQPIPT